MAESTTTIIAPTTNTSYVEPANMATLYGVWIASLVYIFILAIVTVVLNGLTLFVIYKDPLKCFRNPLAIFVTGVIAADFMTGLLGEPLIAYGIVHAWVIDDVAGIRVAIFGFVVSAVTMTVSFLTLLALAICQLLAIGWTGRYERSVSARKAKIGVTLIWVFTSIISIIFAVVLLWVVISLLVLEVTLITITLVVLYIVSYRVFRNRVNRQENPLENQVVTKEFLKGTFIVVMVQIVTVWPYMACAIATPIYYSTAKRNVEDWVNLEIVRTICTMLFLAKFAVDPIILVWRIPKYRRSMKIVYASCLGRCGCAGETETEGRAAYTETRREDFDEHSQENVNVEVI